jgi:uncharacterized protein YjbI with pentapeptide repeats
LQQADLSNAHIGSSTWDEAELTGANFSGTDFTGADLSRMDLSAKVVTISAETNFVGAMLSDGVAHGVNLAGQKLPGFTQFKQHNLAFANLAGMDLSKKADLEGTILPNANLTGANLSEANLTNANLTNAILISATLDFANLRGATLQGVQAGVEPGSVLQTTTFKNAYMIIIDLTDADLRSADLSDAHIYGDATAHSLLIRTKLDSADLSRAILSGAAFSGSLTDATLNNAVLINSTFTRLGGLLPTKERERKPEKYGLVCPE